MLQINAPTHPMSVNPKTTLTNKTTHRYLRFAINAMTLGKKNIAIAANRIVHNSTVSDVIVLRCVV